MAEADPAGIHLGLEGTAVAVDTSVAVGRQGWQPLPAGVAGRGIHPQAGRGRVVVAHWRLAPFHPSLVWNLYM